MKHVLGAFLFFAGIFVAAESAVAEVIDDKRYVCMMQDTLQTKPGVPIDHAGKRYYGCCPMCAEKMTADPARYLKSKDPVSHRVVDKADAFIFSHQGDVHYFESVETRKEFAVSPEKYLTGRH